MNVQNSHLGRNLSAFRESHKDLPISEIAEQVLSCLKKNPRLILTAPTGAGKSTLLPLVLSEAFQEGKILMLEPRRLAAKHVALRMASMLDEEVGETVGYRVRFDTKVSSRTRIEVITEGIMERMLIEDPTLDGVSVVIFDEFHERNLSADLSLALVREIQAVLRPDLRILIMSATIDITSLSAELDAKHISSPGRSYEVKIINGDDIEIKNCALEVARTINKAFNNHEGNILAFLPGVAEIVKCRDLLAENLKNVEILELYGMLPQEKQQKIFSSPKGNIRRIVLATPIAETSLTIEGITVVVDSGLYRTPEFQPSSGLSRLVTRRISMDMADQRAGRAGRIAPGVCYRLWSKATESRLKLTRDPEILTADLAPAMLAVAAWGEADPARLPWVTPPPKGNMANARNLLNLLGVIDNKGVLTGKGKLLAQLPCHPRISSLLIEAGDLKGLACDLAAILEEKDPCQDESNSDISIRLSMLQQYRKNRRPSSFKKIDDISAQYRRLIHCREESKGNDPEDSGYLIAMAYPERIAMRNKDGKYRLSTSQAIVALHPEDNLARYEFLAVAAVGSRIFLAAPISRTRVEEMAKWTESISWNSRDGRAIVQDELRLGSLVLATRRTKGNQREMITAAIATAAPKEGRTMFDFNDEVENLQLRIGVASEWHPEMNFPDVSTDKILALAKDWLPMYIGKASTTQELRKIDMKSVILGLLTYDQQLILDRVTPTHLRLPGGRNVKIQYRRGAEAPVVSARIQDCFGLFTTPTVDDGKRPVLMELLSPGFKPVQLTQDMEGFWRETYFEIRKELRRRYPRHKWPEEPS
ncbi:MAG: ATP-dependent helicase HrpB [Muribaculaceae bacterium]|nr:ATP-dependent helicase HrpB [Muribaculaceae bacterium]